MAGFRCDSKRLSKSAWKIRCGPRPPGGGIGEGSRRSANVWNERSHSGGWSSLALSGLAPRSEVTATVETLHLPATYPFAGFVRLSCSWAVVLNIALLNELERDNGEQAEFSEQDTLRNARGGLAQRSRIAAGSLRVVCFDDRTGRRRLRRDEPRRQDRAVGSAKTGDQRSGHALPARRWLCRRIDLDPSQDGRTPRQGDWLQRFARHLRLRDSEQVPAPNRAGGDRVRV